MKAAGDFKIVERVLQQSNTLYYKWIACALDDIRRLLSKIDFSLVASAREGSFSTHGIFEEVFTQIIKKIDGQYNILHSVNEAAQQELTHEDAKETVIKLVTQIKEASLEMKGLCRRLLHPWMYPLTDARLIFFLFIVAILPFLLHFMQQTPPAVATSSRVLGADLAEVVRALRQQDKSMWDQVLDALRVISQTVLLLPTICFLAALTLSIARKSLPPGAGGMRLRGMEKALYRIGRTVQEALPDSPKGPTFVVTLSSRFRNIFNNSGPGPQNVNTGPGTQNNKVGSDVV